MMNRSSLIAGLVVVLGTLSCEKAVDPPPGISDFLLSNQLQETLLVKVYSENPMQEYQLAVGETKVVLEDIEGCCFGTWAYPADVLDSMEIFSVSNSALIKTYNSIALEDWTNEKADDRRILLQLNITDAFIAK